MQKQQTKTTKKTQATSKGDPGLIHGFRSGLEDLVAEQIRKVTEEEPKYETPESIILYTKPEKQSRYTPDFVLPNGIIIETKGRFVTADRQKHVLIKQQHPEKDIRFVFSNSKTRISKISKTTYGMWCQLQGFQYADKLIPSEWFKEEPKDGKRNQRISNIH